MSWDVIHGNADQMPLRDWSVDCVVTDPPYGMKWTSSDLRFGGKHKVSILNDDKVPVDWLSEAARVLRPQGAMYIFCHWRYWPILAEAVVTRTDMHIHNMIVLAKASHGMGDTSTQYAPMHELVLYAARKGHRLRRPYGRPKDILPVSFIKNRCREHPNQKAGDWVTTFIENSSDPEGMILDPFCGSGTFLREAVRLGRRAIGIELDSRFVRVARKETI